MLLGLAVTALALTGAAAEVHEAATSTSPTENPGVDDCSRWTLDGYHLGMLGTELLAVRSVTLHVEGQAQAVEPGRFHGVLVLDGLNRLEKWGAAYETSNGDALRAEMRERFGEPASDISGSSSGDDSDAARQRRTIWLSRACDTAIIVYEFSSAPDTRAHTISATLARISNLKPGLAEMKTLFH